MALINAAIKRFAFPEKPKAPRPLPLSWIYCPTPIGFIFAFRTTIAACIALGISLWMELDNPAWAAMTVWVVAQLNRGESLSKARWRIVGTFTGALASIVITGLIPQSPWLYYPSIALWIGVCSGCATFFSNFRSYAFVLAGYTCAIICMDSSPDGDKLFMAAVARTSYIILGVTCETVVATLFSTDQEQHAHLKIREKLETALILVSQTLKSVLSQNSTALTSARQQFGTVLKLNDEIEFAEVEMRAYGHEGDHARAALASVSALLARGFGMATRLQLLTSAHKDFEIITHEVLKFLESFPERLKQEDEIPLLLEELLHLRDTCRQYASPLRISIESYDGPAVLTMTDVERISQEEGAEITTPELDERVLFISMGELLGDLEQAITQFHASMHPVFGDHFRFNRQISHDLKIARNNGIRTGLAVIIAALIYEVTAWPNGTTFISMVCVICGLYATQENPVLGTTSFLKGMFCAWVVAWFLVFGFMPMFKTYEPLALILGLAMFIGGLAKTNPSTTKAAAAYCLLMPLMLGLDNQAVMDELSYHNVNLAIMMSGVVSVVVFRSVLPFDSDDERFRMRKMMLKELRSLTDFKLIPNVGRWISHSTDRFSRLIAHIDPTTGSSLTEAAVQGTLATLTLGLNIIRLRALMDREYLPESARRPIILVLHYIERSTKRHGRAARVARAAVRRLRELDTPDHDIITRLELTRALTYLVVIAHTLKTNTNFLDESRPFTGEGPRPTFKQHRKWSFFFKKNS